MRNVYFFLLLDRRVPPSPPCFSCWFAWFSFLFRGRARAVVFRWSFVVFFHLNRRAIFDACGVDAVARQACVLTLTRSARRAFVRFARCAF